MKCLQTEVTNQSNLRDNKTIAKDITYRKKHLKYCVIKNLKAPEIETYLANGRVCSMGIREKTGNKMTETSKTSLESGTYWLNVSLNQQVITIL